MTWTKSLVDDSKTITHWKGQALHGDIDKTLNSIKPQGILMSRKNKPLQLKWQKNIVNNGAIIPIRWKAKV